MSANEQIEQASSRQRRTPLLSTDEVAQRLGVSTRTVRRLATEGRLRKIRIGYRTVRFEADELEELISSSTRNGEQRPGKPAGANTNDHGARDEP